MCLFDAEPDRINYYGKWVWRGYQLKGESQTEFLQTSTLTTIFRVRAFVVPEPNVAWCTQTYTKRFRARTDSLSMLFWVHAEPDCRLSTDATITVLVHPPLIKRSLTSCPSTSGGIKSDQKRFLCVPLTEIIFKYPNHRVQVVYLQRPTQVLKVSADSNAQRRL